jgi:hypothetical protein
LLGHIAHGVLQLELYRSAFTEGMCPIDEETRIRVWWMCFMMVRYVSISHCPLFSCYSNHLGTISTTECKGRTTGLGPGLDSGGIALPTASKKDAFLNQYMLYSSHSNKQVGCHVL